MNTISDNKKYKKPTKGKVANIAWTIIKYFSVIAVSIITLIPLVSILVTSLKDNTEYMETNVMTPPQNWFNFSNFSRAFQTANMGRAFINSTIVLVSVLFITILIGTQLAYVLNRFKFRGNTLIRALFLFAALLPGISMQVTVYKIMTTLGLVNSLPGYILMMSGTDVMSIYIFIQFMENISISLDESAIIDGASLWTIYWKIILPLLKPAIITASIIKGVGVYNEYYSANLYLQTPDLRTVAISLYSFVGPMGSQYNMIAAGVIISFIPALIVFLIFQKQIYSGITAGAVKG